MAKKKRSWPRRILRAALFVLLVPIVLVLLVVGYLHTGSGKERVRALVESRIGAKMNGGEVKIGSLDFALFGDLTLGDVTIVDATGRKAISLDRLRVKPKWGELGGKGPIPLEALELEGLTVQLVKDDQGSNNFRGLFQPIELKKGVAIDKVDISRVAVTILSPDGTKVAVHDVAVHGSLRAQSAIKTYAVDLPQIAASVDIEKPAAGLTVGVKNLTTGLRASIEAGKGTVSLLPLSTEVALQVKPRGIDRTLPIKLGGLSITLGEGDVSADLEKLALGLLTLSAIEVRAPLAEGKLQGVPSAEVLGFRVVGKEVNALLGKELLATDVDVDAHLGGSGDTTTLKAHIAAGDTTIDVDATAKDALGPRPSYKLKTTIKDVDTSELLGSAVTAPPAKLEELVIDAEGSGKDLASLDGHVTINGNGAEVRGVEVDSIAATAKLSQGKVELEELDVKALDQHVALSGSITPTSKEVDMKLRLDGDVDAALARLGPAGVLLSTKIPKGVLTLPKDDLEVRLKGRLDGELAITAKAKKLRALGGTLALDVDAKVLRGDKEKGEKPVTVQSLDAHVSISGLLLSTLLGVRGRKLPKGFDAALDLRLDASGTVEDPKARLTLSGRTIRRSEESPPRKLPTLKLGLTANVTKHWADVDLKLADADAIEDVVLTGKAKLPLSLEGEKKGLAPGGRVAVELDVPRRTLKSLADYTPLTPIPPLSPLQALAPVLEKPNGDIALHATFDGTVADPRGTLDLDLRTARVLGEQSKQNLHVAAKLDKDPTGGTKAETKLTLALDEKPPAVVVDAGAHFPVSPLLGGAARMSYDARVAVGPLALADLPPTPRLERVRALGGTVGLMVNARGNRQDITADVTLDAKGIAPGGKGPFDVGLRVDVAPEKTTLDAGAKIDGSPLVKLSGDVGLGGKGLFARLKEKGFEPTFSLSLQVPERPLASLSKLRPNLANAPGSLSGKIDVTGKPSDPRAAGSIELLGVEMADGSKRGVVARVTLDEVKAALSLSLGASGREASAPALGSIDVAADRSALVGYRYGDPLPIEATFNVKGAPVAALVPAMVAKDARNAFAGSLDWDMKARVVLEKKDDATHVQDADLGGKLSLSRAKLLIPGTKRTYQNVSLMLRAEKDHLHLDGLEAHESDKDVKDRSLKITGEVTLDKIKPKRVDLHLAADKWLLFGTKAIGLPDAPRGTLDLDARATMELDRPIKTAAVDVKKLVVLFPDRFDKAHQPEDVHVGDVFFVGKGPAVGKLPVPEKPQPAAPSTPAPAADGEPKPAESGMDVEIRIAKGAKLLQSPLELHPSGAITIQIRPEGRKIRGKLDMAGGELSLGGKMHPLKRGALTFDDKTPTGWIDLWFARELPPWALRNVSSASGGDEIEIHMFGPISDRRTVLAGAGPGALYDLLSLHNVGRERFVTDADLPESNTVEFPQHQGLLTLSFLSVNLPHLLFLDRVAAWNDELDQPKAYGQLDHYEADRYFADGHGRIRAARRPPDVGKSEAEVEALYLFENTPQLLFGVGGAGGSRGGGGPGVVLEWSSQR